MLVTVKVTACLCSIATVVTTADCGEVDVTTRGAAGCHYLKSKYASSATDSEFGA